MEQGTQKSGRRALQGEGPGSAKSLGQVHACCVLGRAERPVWLKAVGVGGARKHGRGVPGEEFREAREPGRQGLVMGSGLLCVCHVPGGSEWAAEQRKERVLLGFEQDPSGCFGQGVGAGRLVRRLLQWPRQGMTEWPWRSASGP